MYTHVTQLNLIIIKYCLLFEMNCGLELENNSNKTNNLCV